MATAKWTAYAAADTAVASASLNNLGTGSYALGAAIANGTDLALYGDLEVILSGAVTAGTGSPHIAVYLLPAMDGTNYPTPPGASAGAAPAGYYVGMIQANASASFTIGHLRGIVLPPCSFKIQIQNVLGVALPATNTSTVKLYRYSEQSV